MRLRVLKTMGKLKSLLITSALPQDGKSTMALNLATVLATGWKPPFSDRGRPLSPQRLAAPGPSRPARVGGMPRKWFGSDVRIRRLEPLRWYLLQAGDHHGNPTELLQSDSLPGVLQRLSPHFDWILVDTPPVAPLTDALLIAQHVDGCILVVRADRTPREAVEEAIKLLGPKRVLGILFNGAEGLNRLYSKYYGYYGKK